MSAEEAAYNAMQQRQRAPNDLQPGTFGKVVVASSLTLALLLAGLNGGLLRSVEDAGPVTSWFSAINTFFTVGAGCFAIIFGCAAWSGLGIFLGMLPHLQPQQPQQPPPD